MTRRGRRSVDTAQAIAILRGARRQRCGRIHAHQPHAWFPDPEIDEVFWCNSHGSWRVQ